MQPFQNIRICFALIVTVKGDKEHVQIIQTADNLAIYCPKIGLFVTREKKKMEKVIQCFYRFRITELTFPINRK